MYVFFPKTNSFKHSGMPGLQRQGLQGGKLYCPLQATEGANHLIFLTTRKSQSQSPLWLDPLSPARFYSMCFLAEDMQ